jgi:hypothetical protein
LPVGAEVIRTKTWRPTNILGGRREDGIDVELVVVLSPQGRKKKMASLL